MTNQLKTSWRLTCVMLIVGAALSGYAKPAIAQESRDTYLSFRIIGNMGSEDSVQRKGVRAVLFPVGMTILSGGHIKTIPPMTVGYAWDDTRTIPYLFTSAGKPRLTGTRSQQPVQVLGRPYVIELPGIGITGISNKLVRGSDIACKGCKIPGRYLALPWGRSGGSARFHGPQPITSWR